MKKSVLMLVAAASLFGVQAHAASSEVRQEVRQVSRDIKQDCREGVAGNADCRQEHRENKQDAREKANDIKR